MWEHFYHLQAVEYTNIKLKYEHNIKQITIYKPHPCIHVSHTPNFQGQIKEKHCVAAHPVNVLWHQVVSLSISKPANVHIFVATTRVTKSQDLPVFTHSLQTTTWQFSKVSHNKDDHRDDTERDHRIKYVRWQNSGDHTDDYASEQAPQI